ncbi:MAG: SDR family NAD(P)-dependent oxidoreductase [Methylomonas sp.]
MKNETAQPIAVIGMACQYPGAANLIELWENILTRRQQFREMPDVRLPPADYYDPDNGVPDKTYGCRAAVLDGFEFDPRRYRIPKSMFESTDIVHWLALATALEAFEHAGLHGDKIPRERTGVILGNTLTGEETRSNTLRLRWPFVRRVFRRAADAHGLTAENRQAFESTMEQLYKSVFPSVTEDSLAGGLANTIAGRICNYLDLHGGGYIVDGACSSSLLSIATAADYLNHNKLDLVLAGGVDVSLDTFELVGFAKATALSKDEMRVYDKRGNGFIPGEGCGMAILKRLEDARRDGDRVYAVLRGWGLSTDGRGGITAPSVKGQARALIRAYQSAGYSPDTLDFIEGHGTGTAVGDRVELEGIASAVSEFGGAPDHSIGVTSFKSIVGHTKAAAGIGGFIKTVIALNRRVIPPTAGCQQPHGGFTDSARVLYPIMQGKIREPGAQLRAGVSAMGFGGINCHVTLESGDPPAPELNPQVSEGMLLASFRSAEAFPFSAADLQTLIDAVKNALRNVKGVSTGELVDFAAVCAEEVQNLPWRAVVIADSVSGLTAKLETLAARLRNQPPQSGEIWRNEDIWLSYNADCARIGFLFPGQGSQQLGMAGSLTKRFDWAKSFTDLVDKEVAALREELGDKEHGPDLSTLYLPDFDFEPGNIGEPAMIAELTLTQNAQPAICAASWLWLNQLQLLGIRPVAVGGHSLGELTALAAAEVYDRTSLVRFAALRGMAMSAPAGGSGGMAALSCEAETAEKLLESLETGYCVIANRNSPKQTVISGESEAVARVLELAGLSGVRGVMLPVSNAFHSRLVASAADRLRQSDLIAQETKPAQCRLFTGIGGQEIGADLDLRNHLADQIVAPVDFSRLLESMSEHCDMFIEVGPGRVLTGLVQGHGAEAVRPCFPVESKPGKDADLNAVIAEAFVRGGELNWPQLYAGRLVRMFVPASKRKFYVNPCEREFADVGTQRQIDMGSGSLPPLNIPDLVQKIIASPSLLTADVVTTQRPPVRSSSVRSLLMGLICERTGFSEDSISDGARLIDDLNLDSIKIGALIGDAALQLGVAGKVDAIGLASADLKQLVTAFEAAVGDESGSASVLELLFGLVAEHTGFNLESLAPEQKLLDDLNIDSIKAAALLGELLLETQTQNRIQADVLTNATLGEIASRVQAAMPSSAAHAGDAETIPAKIQRQARWVRAFYQTKIAAPLNADSEPGLSFAQNMLLIAPGGNSPFAEQFARKLGASLCFDAPSADFAGFPTRITILLDGAGLCAVSEGVRQLSVFQRLNRQHPALWQSLQTIVFVQTQSEGKAFNSPEVWSFAASIHQERPELEVVVLGVDRQLSAEFITGQIAAELNNEARYHAVEYDAAGNRWLRRIKYIEAEQCSPRHLSWSPHDVLLVTGGGKGITAECALEFVRETGVKLAIIGRSAAPRSGEKSELAATLAKLALLDIEYRYYAADVADCDALEAAVASIHRDLGPITAVLHGAGGNTPRRVVDVSASEAEAEIATKLRGAENLLTIFESAPLKLFAVFTSIIGVTGMRNNAWYAYSNESVARLLESYARAHPETATAAYAFGVWDEVGMGVKLGSVRHLEQIGIDAISVRDGVRQFMRWAKYAPPSTEVIVIASHTGLAAWRPEPINADQPVTGRFLGSVLHSEPGVERISRFYLDDNHDLYLQDHNYRGSLLFPTVMGLEAMAQNCRALIGDPDLDVVRIENIRLERPIVVMPGRKLALEIRVLAGERESISSPRIVEASIRTEQTGWEQAHFSANFIFGKRQARHAGELMPPARGILGIVPSLDLYGEVLFQGPLFQRISAVEELSRGGVKFITEARRQTVSAPEGFSEQVGAPLTLGDPYYRDTLLQAAQLSMTPEICLPFRIEAIDLYAHADTAGRYRAQAKITGREGSKIFGEVVVVDAENHVIECISGYEMQLMEHRSDFPTPEQLLAKPYNEQQLQFQKKLDQAARELGFYAPAAVLRCIPRLSGKNKQARHELEAPVFQTALCLAGERYSIDLEAAQIGWLDSGKPVVFESATLSGDQHANAGHAIGVSLSHEGDWILCIAGNGAQGCDLAANVKLSPEQWRAMLNARLIDSLQRLEREGDSLERAGTRLWSALEAAMKNYDARELTLEIDKRKDDTVIFLASSGGYTVRILTLPIVLAGIEHMLAVTVSWIYPLDLMELKIKPPADQEMIQLEAAESIEALSGDKAPAAVAGHAWKNWLTGDGETAEFFGVKAGFSAGNNQRSIRFRFPISFKDCANPDGTVYFVRFFELMGRLREMALRPVMGQLTAEFTSGEYAWVTNQSSVQIHSPALSGDVVEVDCSFLGQGGPKNSMVSVGFDWRRIGADGVVQPLASSRIQMTWARVVGHGVVKPEGYPSYLNQYFKEFTNDGGDRPDPGADGFNKALKRLGSIDWRGETGPNFGEFLHQQTISTSVIDANLVGNIYYTKYYELQGVLRDNYFFKAMPEAYQIPGGGGLRCLFAEVKHLRDAMPFDTLDARMYLNAVYENGIELRFDFFRINADGSREKLAVGVHIAAWSVLSKDAAEWVLAALPEKLLGHLTRVSTGYALSARSKEEVVGMVEI